MAKGRINCLQEVLECNPSMCNLMINPAFYFKISYLYFFEIIIIMAVSGIVDESSCCFLHSCEIKTLNHNRYLANKIRFSTYIIVQQRMKKRITCNFLRIRRMVFLLNTNIKSSPVDGQACCFGGIFCSSTLNILFPHITLNIVTMYLTCQTCCPIIHFPLWIKF